VKRKENEKKKITIIRDQLQDLPTRGIARVYSAELFLTLHTLASAKLEWLRRQREGLNRAPSTGRKPAIDRKKRLINESKLRLGDSGLTDYRHTNDLFGGDVWGQLDGPAGLKGRVGPSGDEHVEDEGFLKGCEEDFGYDARRRTSRFGIRSRRRLSGRRGEEANEGE
jgi:hypothetical protein